jgi:hypothetical protein
LSGIRVSMLSAGGQRLLGNKGAVGESTEREYSAGGEQ